MDTVFVDQGAGYTLIPIVVGVLVALVALLLTGLCLADPEKTASQRVSGVSVGGLVLLVCALSVAGGAHWGKVATVPSVHNDALASKVVKEFPAIEEPERGFLAGLLSNSWTAPDRECLTDVDCQDYSYPVYLRSGGEVFWVKADEDHVFLVDSEGTVIESGGLDSLRSDEVASLIEEQTVLSDVRIVDAEGNKVTNDILRYQSDGLDDQKYFAVGNYNGVFLRVYFSVNSEKIVEAVPEASGKVDVTAEDLKSP